MSEDRDEEKQINGRLDFSREEDLRRLDRAVEESYRKLRNFRDERLRFLRHFVGYHYGEQGASDKEALNLLFLATVTFMRKLAPRAPTALVTTEYTSLQPYARVLQDALNYVAARIHLRETLRLAVLEALYGFGIVKIGITHDGGNFVSSIGTAGLPYCDVVPFEDWVHDTNANRLEESQFYGNKYRLTRQEVFDNPLFDTDRLKKLEEALALQDKIANEDSAASIGARQSEDVYLSKKIELYDIFVPLLGALVTYTNVGGRPCLLRLQEWNGPDRGPYVTLGFFPVLQNTMPLPFMAVLFDLHDLVNRLFRKLGRQAERQKTIYAYAGVAQQDAQRIRDASDGELVRVEDPNRVKEYRFGGVDRANFAFMLQLRSLFSYLAGNLDAIGGLAAQAETLGQERLLVGGATDLVADMQSMVYDFCRRIFRQLGWYLWTDPIIDIPLLRKVAGIQIPVRFDASMRKGEYYDYNIDVQPYSLQEPTPAERLQLIFQMMTQVAVPLMPMLQRQGIGIDMRRFVELVAEYSNVPELRDILVSMPTMPVQPAEPGEPRRPPSNGTYRHLHRQVRQRPAEQDLIESLFASAEAGEEQ